MNKKIGYIFGLLVLGLFMISACQQDTVGGRVLNKEIVDKDIGARQIDGGDDEGDKYLRTLCKCVGGTEYFECDGYCKACCGSSDKVQEEFYI